MLLSKIVSKIQERKGRDFKFLTFTVQILELLNKINTNDFSLSFTMNSKMPYFAI